MTNHDESTQDETVADSPARPSRWKIAGEAAWTGTMAAVLIWLVARFWQDPNWFDGIGAIVYAVFTGFFLATLIKVSRRRWAPTPPTGYMDRDGDQWYVQADGRLALSPRDDAPGVDLEEVRRDYGPLEPIYG